MPSAARATGVAALAEQLAGPQQKPAGHCQGGLCKAVRLAKHRSAGAHADQALCVNCENLLLPSTKNLNVRANSFFDNLCLDF